MTKNYNKTYWNKIFFLDNIFLRILEYNRHKIYQIFLKEINFTTNKKLLDVGTTPVFDGINNYLLNKFKNRKNITSLSNLDCSSLKKFFVNINFVKADARQMNFRDNYFDIVYSNAVLEHVGSHNNQLKFIKECFRVSKKIIFIATPNKYYPIEFHTKIPLLHFLQSKIYRKILKFLGLDFFSKEKNLNLLSIKDLKDICFKLNIKNYKIIKHKFLFLTSNFILIIKK